jgi:hypothetical protein
METKTDTQAMRRPSSEEIESFGRKLEAFQLHLAKLGIDEDEIVAEFQALRKEARQHKKLPAHKA